MFSFVGLHSYACSGTTNTYCSWHMLRCDKGELISIISSCYGFTYFRYRRSNCLNPHCNISFTDTNEIKLNDCEGKQACNFRSSDNSIPVCKNNGFHIPYQYSIVKYDCRTALPTESQTRTTLNRQSTTEVSEPGKIIRSTPAKNNSTDTASIRVRQSTEWFIERGMHRKPETTDIDETNIINYNYKHNTDASVIVGSVMGSLLLVVVVLVIIYKRHTISTFIDSRFKESSKVTNPVSETPTDGCTSNPELRNDKTPSYVLSNDCYHLHDNRKHDDTYSHLHGVNTNNIRIDDRSDGEYNHLRNDNYHHLTSDFTHEVSDSDYNHLGEVSKGDNYHHLNDFKNRTSGGMEGADYNHLGDVSKDDNYHHLNDFKNRTSVERITRGVDYSHLHDVFGENAADDYDQIGDIRSNEIPQADRKDVAYVNHGSVNDHCDDTHNQMTRGNYTDRGAVKSELINEDVYNHIDYVNHDTDVKYELAKSARSDNLNMPYEPTQKIS
ncbi:uncharacterized protein LOC126810244 isoform X2 [Patella vulgata]|uniref:uncharacterized protein LOC126810244 isoform X2 n=1 Tax=Patella vulgata TaxID=6465 RepID=UPI00218097EA|nr:uncharacterized protein LOC126810244 isoform X2 [Patella vulgata]